MRSHGSCVLPASLRLKSRPPTSLTSLTTGGYGAQHGGVFGILRDSPSLPGGGGGWYAYEQRRAPSSPAAGLGARLLIVPSASSLSFDVFSVDCDSGESALLYTSQDLADGGLRGVDESWTISSIDHVATSPLPAEASSASAADASSDKVSLTVIMVLNTKTIQNAALSSRSSKAAVDQDSRVVLDHLQVVHSPSKTGRGSTLTTIHALPSPFRPSRVCLTFDPVSAPRRLVSCKCVPPPEASQPGTLQLALLSSSAERLFVLVPPMQVTADSPAVQHTFPSPFSSLGYTSNGGVLGVETGDEFPCPVTISFHSAPPPLPIPSSAPPSSSPSPFPTLSSVPLSIPLPSLSPSFVLSSLSGSIVNDVVATTQSLRAERRKRSEGKAAPSSDPPDDEGGEGLEGDGGVIVVGPRTDTEPRGVAASLFNLDLGPRGDATPITSLASTSAVNRMSVEPPQPKPASQAHAGPGQVPGVANPLLGSMTLSLSVSGLPSPALSVPLSCPSPSLFASVHERGGDGKTRAWSLVCVGGNELLGSEKAGKTDDGAQIELLLLTHELAHRIKLSIETVGCVRGVAMSRRRTGGNSKTTLIDVFVAFGVLVEGSGARGRGEVKERPIVRTAATVEEYDVAIFRRTVSVTCDGGKGTIREERESGGEGKEADIGGGSKSLLGEEGTATERALLRIEERLVSRLEALERVNKDMAAEISECHEKIKLQGDMIKKLLDSREGKR